MTTELKVGQPLGKGPPERSQQVSVHGSRFSRLGSRPQKAGAQREIATVPSSGCCQCHGEYGRSDGATMLGIGKCRAERIVEELAQTIHRSRRRSRHCGWRHAVLVGQVALLFPPRAGYAPVDEYDVRAARLSANLSQRARQKTLRARSLEKGGSVIGPCSGPCLAYD